MASVGGYHLWEREYARACLYIYMRTYSVKSANMYNYFPKEFNQTNFEYYQTAAQDKRSQSPRISHVNELMTFYDFLIARCFFFFNSWVLFIFYLFSFNGPMVASYTRERFGIFFFFNFKSLRSVHYIAYRWRNFGTYILYGQPFW